jgi:hypothetical protein
MMVIGRVCHILALIGWFLVIRPGNILRATGKETAAGLNMTITGITIETGTIVRKTGITNTSSSADAIFVRQRCGSVQH